MTAWLNSTDPGVSPRALGEQMRTLVPAVTEVASDAQALGRGDKDKPVALVTSVLTIIAILLTSFFGQDWGIASATPVLAVPLAGGLSWAVYAVRAYRGERKDRRAHELRVLLLSAAVQTATYTGRHAADLDEASIEASVREILSRVRGQAPAEPSPVPAAPAPDAPHEVVAARGGLPGGRTIGGAAAGA